MEKKLDSLNHGDHHAGYLSTSKCIRAANWGNGEKIKFQLHTKCCQAPEVLQLSPWIHNIYKCFVGFWAGLSTTLLWLH